jgi:pantothenate synthetase
MDPNTLEPVPLAAPGCIVAIAVRIGKTRLIDNVILGAPDDTA